VSAIDHALLEGYLVRTRWFGGKGRPFHVSQVRTLAELSDGAGGPRATVHLVTVDYSDDEGGRELYQVPLVAYREIKDRIAHAYVGEVDVDGRVHHLYDAIHDRDAMALWLEGFIAAEHDGTSVRGGLRFRRVSGGRALDPDVRSSPLTGEQSNSSLRFDDSAIMKVFRKVSAGVNPDIEINHELTRGGSEHIAELYGWIEAEVDGELFHLAMMQEFFRTAADGFELAISSVRTVFADLDQTIADSGGDFAGEAARLGEALAEVHASLRERFPAERRGAETTAALAGAMTARLDQALHTVPEIRPFAGRLRAAYDAVAALGGLDVQRVHGDLHLGQALRTSHGWRIVDFEGEPGRDFSERAMPDSPWRDVAGMLRSFDYAPGVVEMSAPGAGSPGDEGEELRLRADRAREWSERAREHFLAAYSAALSTREASDDRPADTAIDAADRRVLLDAYEADKAVYEAVYEKRNRPAWVTIPLAAIARLGS